MRFLSGIQPTAKLHIGNYLGAIKLWIEELKNNPDSEAIFFVADYHAITVPHDPISLKEGIFHIVAAYLAAGLDVKKHTIFVQSQNPDHTEAAWILLTQTPIGWLERMTQYKDKIKKLREEQKSIGTGLLCYPVLMAADILLYDADIVPVGEDQVQHVELTQEIARRINQRYGEIFKIPRYKVRKVGARIKDLADPTKKMSKSASSYKGVIFLTDDDDTIRKKITRAVTDSEKVIRYDPIKKPGISNLLVILSLATGEKITTLQEKYEGISYAQFKQDVADAVIEMIRPLREKINEYLSDKTYLNKILAEGLEKARELSSTKLRLLKEKLGYPLPKKNQ